VSWPTAEIEILDNRDGEDLAIPDMVRINGVAVAVPKDFPPKVHDFEPHGGPVMVTVTMYARRVVIGHTEQQEATA
jgi:hypothetical protein